MKSALQDLLPPERQAQIDFADGQGQSANPYEHDSHPDSQYSRYAWEMHRLAVKAFKPTREEINNG